MTAKAVTNQRMGREFGDLPGTNRLARKVVTIFVAASPVALFSATYLGLASAISFGMSVHSK